MFVADATGKRTLELDAVAGTPTSTVYVGNPSAISSGSAGMVYTRPNGHPVLWTNLGDVFDIETKSSLTLLRDGLPLIPANEPLRRSASVDGATLLTTSTIAVDGGIDRWLQRFVVLGQRGLEYDPLNGTVSSGGQMGIDMCSLPSGARLASLGTQRLFSVTPTSIAGLPGLVTPIGIPVNAVVCGADNRFYVGIGVAMAPQNNLYVFDADGNPVTSLLSSLPFASRRNGLMRISADGSRIISATLMVDSNNNVNGYLSIYGL